MFYNYNLFSIENYFTSIAALARFEAATLNINASFQTGLHVLRRAAVLRFLTRFPPRCKYTFTNGSKKKYGINFKL